MARPPVAVSLLVLKAHRVNVSSRRSLRLAMFIAISSSTRRLHSICNLRVFFILRQEAEASFLSAFF